jgi:hypothetical protein
MATWNDYSIRGLSDSAKTFDFHSWDKTKARGCVCDPLYGDVDCSKKMCPYGTDVLDTRDNLLISAKYQTQQIYLVPANQNGGHSSLVGTDNAFSGKTFALTFKSRLNETFTTIPIVANTGDLRDLVHDIQTALLTLPNRVIDGVSVAAATTAIGVDYGLLINVTFTGPSVQGPQHLLTVEADECQAGCTPKLTGLDLWTKYESISSNITELQLSDFNSYECGRRGKCDYSSGLCTCFTGYTGENCDTLTTLV